VAISNSASPEIIWGLGAPHEEDHQLHQCCWTGRVGEREEEEDLFTKRAAFLYVGALKLEEYDESVNGQF